MTSLALRLGLLLALLAVGLACGQAAPPSQGQPIVAGIPWPDYEEATYALLDDAGQEVAQSVFTIQREGDRFRLSQRYRSPNTTDEVVALVSAADLAPIEVQRVILGDRGELRFQVNYLSGIVEIVRTTAEDRRSDQLNVPPNAYDNASSPFLWRTIPFAPDYQATYANMITAVLQRSHQATATVRVVGRERVKVPAGVFEAWRVEVRLGGERQVVWYATDEGHPLVMYDNSQQRFVLQALTQR